MPAERPALDRLLGSASAGFAEEVWGRAPLLVTSDERAAGDDLSDLFSLAAADELLAGRGLRTPFLRLAKDGKTLPDKDFTTGGGVGAGISDQIDEDKVRRRFADGATVVLQALHRTWPPVARLVDGLSAELGHPIQANCYLTPPQNQGFGAHYDVHDVFVLQVHGSKEWIVHAPVVEHPLRDQPWAEHRTAVQQRAAEEPLLRLTLRPGDCLYLPRGYLHSARATGGISGHLTLGVHTWTRHHLADALADEALRALRELTEARVSLPLGIEVDDPAALAADLDAVRQEFQRLLADLPDERIAAALLADARNAQRPAAVPPFQALADAEALTDADTLRLRTGLLLRIEEAADGSSLRTRAGRCTVDDAQVAAVRRLAKSPAGVAELREATGVSRDGLRMLIREGILERGAEAP
ncbi:cupin [Enemella evansiae]|uniref:Cupin n=1 Tax=Enemella evansiae TaxID=2016499 RepID=A0A255GWK9_9ACTN|nr:cupin domain-containing protein [Enemella evansiae]OYO09387.1 cupin [Enemella evansiae]OYO17854.1 cupin [Enemella evansiae]